MTDNEFTIKSLKEILEVMLCEGDLQRTSTISHTIDLINHLQAENERLKNVVEYKQGIIDVLFTDNAKLLAKQSEIQATATTNILRNMEAAIETAKAEAYKECIEKAKNAILPQLNTSTLEEKETYYFCLNILDNLLKGLVGENQ